MLPLSWIEISQKNLLHNIFQIQSILGDHQLGVVVKGNAYGHGLAEVVSAIESEVDYFQVDDFKELKELRAHTQKSVLVLGYMTIEESVKAFEDFDAIVGIFCCDQGRFEQLNEAGRKLGKKVKVHLEVDALLGRLGVLEEDIRMLVQVLREYNNIAIESLYAHFSDIEDSKNLTHACNQSQQINLVAQELGIPYHISATSGILSDPHRNWGGCMMRLGIGLYGVWPSESLRIQWNDKVKLLPVLSWKTRIAQVKMLPKGYPIGYGRSFITVQQTKIAIIPQGYSDGYDRKFSNQGVVLIGGTRCNILGRIAMNMFVVDVSHLDTVEEGEEVVLIGSQGREMVSVEELAEMIGTINYEILARISPLLPRKIV